jgi:protein subunit release factor B
VTCRQDRSQHQNKQTCLRRLRRRLLTLQQAPPERLPTQPPADVRERRLAEKARQAAKKRSRNAPAETDD